MNTSRLLSLLACSAGLLAGSASAQLTNGGFETGDLSGWLSAGTAAVSSDQAHSGDWSVFVPMADVSLVEQALPASPGQIWNFSGYAFMDETAEASNFSLLKIVWRGVAGDLEVGDILIGSPDLPAFPGIRSDPVLDAGNTPTDWFFMEAAGVAPAGTTEVAFFAISVQVGGSDTMGVYYDDLEASLVGTQVIPEPSLASIAGLVLIAGVLAGRRRRR